MSDQATEIPPQQEHYPEIVVSEDDRRRWDLSVAIAEQMSATFEPSGEPNSLFVMDMAPRIYRSELPTHGVPIAEAAELEVEEAADPAEVMWAELERTKPGPEAPDEAQWEHVGKITDLFELLFGNPDELGVDDYDGQMPPPGRGLSTLEESEVLEEVFEHVLHRPYSAQLHPKDRMGKWTVKLHAVRAFAAKNRDAVKRELAVRVAATALRHRVRNATEKGGALHGDISAAHPRHPDKAAQMRAHAAEERARSGLSGVRQQAIRQHNRSKAAALTAMAYVYSEKAEEKLGPFHENFKDSAAAMDTLDRADNVKEISHEAAKYVMEHRHEIHAALHVVKHVAHEVARAKGLTAADDTGPEPDGDLYVLGEEDIELLVDPESEDVADYALSVL